MPNLQAFADTFLRLFEEHRFEHTGTESIKSLSLDATYALQQMVIDAETQSTHHDSEDSQNHYSEPRKSGNCPPGLAKKNNGCQPPGQIKKWRKGEPLPGDVIYYDLPSALIDELGLTPEGDRVVQVGTDLLLISIGTGIVLDAFDIQE